MASDGNIRAIITTKYLIKHRFAPDIFINLHFSLQWLPQQVILRESRLNLVSRESIMDVSLGATSVTSVAADTFTEELLHSGDEGLTGWQIQTKEGDVGGFQAPG